MQLRMHENSLFAVLLRSAWWISVAIAVGLFLAARLFLPDVYAFFVALPFLVIGAIAGWKQLRAPSTARIADTMESVRAMGWGDFSRALEDAYRRDGYAVNRLSGAEADFELTRSGRVVLVSCKRWKVARTGIEPLRELYAAKRAREAHACIYVVAGEVTDNARKFAAANNIRLADGPELARLLGRSVWDRWKRAMR
jgi:restriction system protein